MNSCALLVVLISLLKMTVVLVALSKLWYMFSSMVI